MIKPILGGEEAVKAIVALTRNFNEAASLSVANGKKHVYVPASIDDTDNILRLLRNPTNITQNNGFILDTTNAIKEPVYASLDEAQEGVDNNEQPHPGFLEIDVIARVVVDYIDRHGRSVMDGKCLPVPEPITITRVVQEQKNDNMINKFIVDKIEKLERLIEDINIANVAVLSRTDEATGRLDEVFNKIDDVSNKTDEALNKIEDVSNKVDETTTRMDETTARIDENENRVNDLQKSQENNNADEMYNLIIGKINNIASLVDNSMALADKVDEVQNSVRDAMTELTELKSDMQLTKTDIGKQSESFVDVRSELWNLKEDVGKTISSEMVSIRSEMQGMRDAVSQASDEKMANIKFDLQQAKNDIEKTSADKIATLEYEIHQVKDDVERNTNDTITSMKSELLAELQRIKEEISKNIFLVRTAKREGAKRVVVKQIVKRTVAKRVTKKKRARNKTVTIKVVQKRPAASVKKKVKAKRKKPARRSKRLSADVAKLVIINEIDRLTKVRGEADGKMLKKRISGKMSEATMYKMIDQLVAEQRIDRRKVGNRYIYVIVPQTQTIITDKSNPSITVLKV